MRNCIIHLKNSISIALCSAYIEFTQSDYGIVFGIRPYAGYRALLPIYERILTPSQYRSFSFLLKEFHYTENKQLHEIIYTLEQR